jgi:hypothetical protein
MEPENPSPIRGGRIRLSCRAAADLVHTGQNEEARGILGELWRDVGERPLLKGFEERATAGVLLQAGTLSGWSGVRDYKSVAISLGRR